jgi:hypothetical protein
MTGLEVTALALILLALALALRLWGFTVDTNDERDIEP